MRWIVEEWMLYYMHQFPYAVYDHFLNISKSPRTDYEYCGSKNSVLFTFASLGFFCGTQ